MRVSTMVRWTSLAAVMGLLAACSDAPTAAKPMGEVAVTKEFEFSKVLSATTFDIVPGQATLVSVDGNLVYVPADALCAAGSGYGRQYFDQPCARETQRQSFAMIIGMDLNGNPMVSFNRDVRFSPDRAAYVILKVGSTANRGAPIKWWDAAQLKWVDEGSYDSQQKTYWSSNLVWRRLKHFSGYNVGQGNCDPMLDPSCETGDAPPPSF
ncbi:MAG TPA: hypothetical protein VGD77_01895 [Gemmatimonadaceae bacterium]